MQRLEVSGAVRPIYGSLGVKRLVSETCSAHKKWDKIASDIKLVFHSSTIAMMHGPINIRFRFSLRTKSPYILIWLGLGVISGVRRDAAQIWAPLVYYAAYSGNIMPTFRDKILVPNLENETDRLSRNVGNCHYRLRNVTEKHRPRGKVCLWQHYLLNYKTQLFKIDIFGKLTTRHWRPSPLFSRIGSTKKKKKLPTKVSSVKKLTVLTPPEAKGSRWNMSATLALRWRQHRQFPRFSFCLHAL